MAESRSPGRRQLKPNSHATGTATAHAPRDRMSAAGSNRAEPLPIPPGPHRRAGRKRGLSRNMRRFESVMGRVDLPGKLASGKQNLLHVGANRAILSKMTAALLLLGVVVVLYTTHARDEWFVYAENIHFEPLTYLDTPGLIDQLQVEGWNIFWLEPASLRQRLLEHTGVADAHVRLQLPGRIEVSVIEKQPVALWITNRGVYRLADNGTALSRGLTSEEITASPADMALPHIVDPLQEAQKPGVSDDPIMDDRVLHGALSILESVPELDYRLRYNRNVGFNFALPDGEGWVYWGDGLHVDEKRLNLQAARQYMAENSVESRIVDVRFPNRPYLR